MFMSEPQMPCVGAAELVEKQMPRHWMLRACVSPGSVTVNCGLQGEPSGSRVRSMPVAPQVPVRALQICPVGQSEFCEQWGKQPVASGVPPACVNHQPVQTKPARQPPVADVVPAVRHEAKQFERAFMPSPCVRQVEPAPPHCVRSLVCDALFSQPLEQMGVDGVGMQRSSPSPQAGSAPPMGSGMVQEAPARLAPASAGGVVSRGTSVAGRTSAAATSI